MPRWQAIIWTNGGYFTNAYMHHSASTHWVPWRCSSNFMVFKITIHGSSLSTQCEIALRWMPHNLNNGKSTMAQVMAWCCQAASCYVSQCWPRFLSWYGVTRPQCVMEVSCIITIPHKKFGLVIIHWLLSNMLTTDTPQFIIEKYLMLWIEILTYVLSLFPYDTYL